MAHQRSVQPVQGIGHVLALALLSAVAFGQSAGTQPNTFDQSAVDNAEKKLQQMQAARAKASTQAAMEEVQSKQPQKSDGKRLPASSESPSAGGAKTSDDLARLEGENASLRKEVSDFSQSLREMQHKEAASAKAASEQQPGNEALHEVAGAMEDMVETQAEIEKTYGSMLLPPLVESYDTKIGTVTVDSELWKGYSVEDQLMEMRSWYSMYTLRNLGKTQKPIIVLDGATHLQLNTYDGEDKRAE